MSDRPDTNASANDGESDGTGGDSTTDAATEAAPVVPRRVLLIVLVVSIVLIVGVIVAGRTAIREQQRATETELEQQRSAPVPVVSLPAPDSQSQACTDLVESLPETLGDANRVSLMDPAPAGVAAYRLPDARPIIVRCGLEQPPSFVKGSALQLVDGVQWFSESDRDPAVTGSTWVAVDRAVTIAVTLPEGSGPTAIQDLSSTIGSILPATAPSPGEPR